MNHERITGTNVFQHANEDVLVGELEHVSFAQWYAQIVYYFLGELRMGIARKYPQFVHQVTLLLILSLADTL